MNHAQVGALENFLKINLFLLFQVVPFQNSHKYLLLIINKYYILYIINIY